MFFTPCVRIRDGKNHIFGCLLPVKFLSINNSILCQLHVGDPKSGFWPLEEGAGMEKFRSGITSGFASLWWGAASGSEFALKWCRSATPAYLFSSPFTRLIEWNFIILLLQAWKSAARRKKRRCSTRIGKMAAYRTIYTTGRDLGILYDPLFIG